MVTGKQIAKWKAHPAPYCVTRYSKAVGNYVPVRKGGTILRFATPADAIAECARRAKYEERMTFVDFADAYRVIQP